jgi:hypothetical protein
MVRASLVKARWCGNVGVSPIYSTGKKKSSRAPLHTQNQKNLPTYVLELMTVTGIWTDSIFTYVGHSEANLDQDDLLALSEQ